MKLLTTAEVGERLGVKAVTVRAWHAGGKLTGEKIGRDLLFKEEDVAALEVERDERAPSLEGARRG